MLMIKTGFKTQRKMDSHLFAGNHNLSTTIVAVYTFIVLAILISRSVSATTAGNIVEIRRNSRFADVDRDGGQELSGGELEISIDISGIRARPHDPEMAHDLSMEEDTSVGLTSSDDIPVIFLRRQLKSQLPSSPGTNNPPGPGGPDPGNG